jgi:hypothetical protein
MFGKRKRRKLAELRFEESLSKEWAEREAAGLPPVGSSEYTRLVLEVVAAAVASLDPADRRLVTGGKEARVVINTDRKAATTPEIGEAAKGLDDAFASSFGLTLYEIEKIRRDGLEGNEDILQRQARRMAGEPSERPKFRTAAEREEDELS